MADARSGGVPKANGPASCIAPYPDRLTCICPSAKVDILSRLTTSDCLQCLGFGHDPAQGAVFVQVAEHLEADGLVQAAHTDRFIAAAADQVRDQVASRRGGSGGEAPPPLLLLPLRRGQRA